VKESASFFSTLPDQSLWRSFRFGDREAFGAIYHRYAQVLYNYGYKVTSDAPLIEDCIQDLFVYLWKNRAGLGETDSIKFYLFRSLRREITRRITGNRLVSESSTDTDDFMPSELIFSHEAFLIEAQTEAEKVVALQQAMQKLTRRQREAITLRFYGNFSYQEIGEIMSLNYQSVCNLVYKSLHILKENMVPLLQLFLLLLFI
jgi:RNA polymerase sigma factor (sigma-70 family)